MQCKTMRSLGGPCLFRYHYKAMMQISADIINKKHRVSMFYRQENHRLQISRGRILASKYQSIHSPQSKKMQQSSHSHLHMAGQHNHRKHAPYYHLQEHHVISTKPFLVISTHDFYQVPSNHPSTQLLL